MWFSLYDKQAESIEKVELLDEFKIPLSFFMPFKPIAIEVGIKGGGKLYLTMTLELRDGLPVDSLDELTTMVLKWVDWDPWPQNSNQ